ncbi:hypothetical protein ABT112_17515 [Streptomyces sp. NPDC002055]|uniref:hypothetical protein n=1 Tax=Streptomyces sp. NPDC002055 TaxID=3154534 RepID=UPI003325E066
MAMVGFLLAASLAGGHHALEERGRWAQAAVVEKRPGKTGRCALLHEDSRPISPELEGRGCSGVAEGEVLRVFYDPQGGADPVVSREPGPPLAVFPVLAVVVVGFGTWGSARISRFGRRYWTE